MAKRIQSTARVWLPVVAAAVVALDISCAGNTPVKAPKYQPEVTQLSPVEIHPYQLRPGDSISVVFWGNSELDQELTIRPDGRISLPFPRIRCRNGMEP